MSVLHVISAIFFMCNGSTYAFEVVPTDNNFDYTGNIPSNTYHKFCKNMHSQGGDNGVIDQLLKELEITNGVVCEFGASNGIELSNTYHLLKNHNFSGMVIEADWPRYLECVKNYTSLINVQVFHRMVLYDDINNDLNAWLKKGGMPHDLDVLSIDIDCDDYYVWANLTEFNPKIVIFEINPYRDPIYEEIPRVPSREYNIDVLNMWFPGKIAVGCSFISAIKLGLKKGYLPVAWTGGNVIFIRKDLVERLKEFPYTISEDPYDYITLYTHFVLLGDKWMTNTGLILNSAIRDYYLTFKKKHIDIEWLNVRMQKILNHNEAVKKSIPCVAYNLIDGHENIFITAESEKIGHTWLHGQVWERHLIQKFYSLLPKNEPCVVFDLGAQTGSFSLLAKYLPLSTWYSFEPIQEAATVLQKNLVLNGIENVSVQHMAASYFSGQTTLQMPPMHQWGLATIGQDVQRFVLDSQRIIPCVDLDSFVEAHAIRKVDFMKLDTEGSELFILRGARAMIMRDHPIILMEYNETNMKQCGVLKQEVDQFLTEMGYEWQLVSTEDILCIPRKN